MTKHYIDIVGKWAFVFAYDIKDGDQEEIGEWLRALGCTEQQVRKACRVAVSMNSGFTFSRSELRMSVMVVAPASSEEQFMNTLVHEIDHLQAAICEYYDVEPRTEEAAYLQGYVMQRVFRALRDDAE